MTGAPGQYELIDHTGDLAIRVVAPSFNALLETAARALFELLLENQAAVKPRTSIDIAIDPARTEEEHLKALLAELLYRFEVNRFVLADLKVDGVWARCRGEVFDPARHTRARSIKAVTYHGLEVIRDHDGGCTASIVFDI